MRGIVLFFCLWPAFSGIQAQRFQGGLVGGVNLSQLDGDLLGGYNQPGLSGGLTVKTLLSEKWSIGMDLLASQQGSMRSKTDNPGAITRSIRLNVVEAPVTLQFKDWKFEVETGLSYSRLFSHRVIDIQGTDISDIQNYRSNILSLVLGVSFRFTERFTFNLRWSKFLNNLQANPDKGKYLGRTIGLRGIYWL